MNAMRLIGLCGVLALSGCSLNRGAPPERSYVLGGRPAPESPAAGRDLGDPAIGLRRLQLAAYLESPLVLVRRGDRAQEISLSEFHRWSEPLGDGISRSLAGYLTARIPSGIVDVAPWPARAKHDYLIELNVVRFEGVVPDGATGMQAEAHVLATWAIVRPEDGEVLARGTTDYRRSGWIVGDYAGLVALLDEGVHELSADLTRGLESLAAR